MKRNVTCVLLLLASCSRLDAQAPWIRLEQSGDQNFFVSGEGGKFLAFGVNHIGALARGSGEGLQVRGNAEWQSYWSTTLKEQFDRWHLTTLGYGGPTELHSKAPWFATIGLAKIEKHRSDPKLTSSNAYQFPDVFDPAWATQVSEQIRRVAAASRNDPLLIGYFWTDTPTWDLHKTRALRGTDWVSAIRQLPAGSAGHQAYVSFLRKVYADQLSQLNNIYGLELSDLSELDSASFAEIAIGRHRVHEDDQAFLALIATRFYNVVGSAQREADPNHLVFGDRYLAGDAPTSILKAATPWIDAVAVQPGDRYSTLFPPSTTYPADEIQRLHRVTGKPVLICDHAISFPTPAQPRTIFEQMPDEISAAEATRTFLDDAFSNSYVVGYLRCQYIDRPAGYGRGLRQGLLRPDGQERKALVEVYRSAFEEVSRRLESAPGR